MQQWVKSYLRPHQLDQTNINKHKEEICVKLNIYFNKKNNITNQYCKCFHTFTLFSLGNRLQIAVKLQYKQDKLPTTSTSFYLHGTPSISSIEFPRGTPSISSTGTPSIADGSQVIGDPSRSSRGAPSISPLSRGIPSNGTPSRSGDLG